MFHPFIYKLTLPYETRREAAFAVDVFEHRFKCRARFIKVGGRAWCAIAFVPGERMDEVTEVLPERYGTETFLKEGL